MTPNNFFPSFFFFVIKTSLTAARGWGRICLAVCAVFDYAYDVIHLPVLSLFLHDETLHHC